MLCNFQKCYIAPPVMSDEGPNDSFISASMKMRLVDLKDLP